MAFCFNPKYKPLREITYEHVVGRWMCLRVLVDWAYWPLRLITQFRFEFTSDLSGYVLVQNLYVLSHNGFTLALFYYACLVCVSPFVFSACITIFISLLMYSLPLTRLSFFTEMQSLPLGMHRCDWLSVCHVGWLNSHAMVPCSPVLVSSTPVKTTDAAPVKTEASDFIS